MVLYETVRADPPLKVEPEAAPLPALLKVTEFTTEPAEPVMEAFSEVVESWYRVPALAPMRPVRDASLGALVKVSVPLKVLLSERRVEEAANVPMQVPFTAKQPCSRLIPP